MTLLEQALKAKDEGRFEQWYASLSPERRETLRAEMELVAWVMIKKYGLEGTPSAGPSETK